MDITLYIADLLRQHNAVYVPSLGVFYHEHRAAYYDAARNEFIPPAHTIGFKEQEEQSTLLAEYISAQKHVSISTAAYFIEKFASYIQTVLSLNGQADMESLGTLQKTSEGFSIRNAISLDQEGEYFGLVPIKEPGTAAQIIAEPLTIPVPEVEAVLPSEPDLTEAMAVEDDESPVGETNRISSRSIFMLLASFLAVAAFISYLTFPEAFQSVNQQTQVPPHRIIPKKTIVKALPMTLEDSLAQADTIYQELTKQGFEVEKPRDTLEVSTEIKTVATAPALTKQEVTFEIIGAAFARRTEAEAYVKQLQQRGLYAKIVENMPGSKLKISLGTFNDESSAQKELARIKADINKEAWIARVKQPKN